MIMHERFAIYVPLLNTIQEEKWRKETDWKDSRRNIQAAFQELMTNEWNMFIMPNEDVYHPVRDLLATIAHDFSNWQVRDEDFCTEVYKKLAVVQLYLRPLDIHPLDNTTLINLGFGNWCNELNTVPIYLLPCIRKGTQLTTTEGRKVTVGYDELDTATIFGCINYGIPINKMAS